MLIHGLVWKGQVRKGNSAHETTLMLPTWFVNWILAIQYSQCHKSCSYSQSFCSNTKLKLKFFFPTFSISIGKKESNRIMVDRLKHGLGPLLLLQYWVSTCSLDRWTVVGLGNGNQCCDYDFRENITCYLMFILMLTCVAVI